MSLDFVVMIAVAAGGLLSIAHALRKLRTGRSHYGANVYTRSAEPAEYWFSLLFAPVALPLLAVALALDLQGDHFRFGRVVTSLCLAVLLAFWLIRALQTERIGIQKIEFARKEDPREFWILMVAYGVALGLMLWMGFQGDWR